MKYDDALAAVFAGKFMTRNAWEKGKYIGLLPYMPAVWMFAITPNPAAGNWQFLSQDYKADDWKELDKEETSQAPVPPAEQEPQGDK